MRECDYGDLSESRAFLVAARRARHIDEPFPDGQSYRQVLTATSSFLNDLATGWDGARILMIAHSANRWALDCLLTGASLVDLLAAPFSWQPGWHYTLPSGWSGNPGT
ncbi:histidine phosphatase family protein [Nonomuraea sp. 3N208]|uniref:histidine phosphatase family protein n=1 Tax=Nonomuraea sp. 3N208 TaxID=3457421 RepID=UPI003FD5A688